MTEFKQRGTSSPSTSSTSTLAKPTDIHYPRWFGGSASCMAVVTSHPFDLVKVRMQTAAKGPKEGFIRIGLGIVRAEGIIGIYRGLSAGCMRALTYGATRIALYEEMKKSTTASPSISTLSAMAAVSGFVGALVGTPSDIANIRMQNDRSLPLENRRNYRNVFDAWIKMKRHEGWRAFYQGLWPNCFRCSIMTASQLASYDVFKRILQKISSTNEELPLIHISASLLASLVATTISSPMDIIRTQLMSSSSSKKASLFTVVKELSRSEGYRWVFRGWTPSFLRLGPQTMATLIFMEQHKRLYRIWEGFE